MSIVYSVIFSTEIPISEKGQVKCFGKGFDSPFYESFQVKAITFYSLWLFADE